jgi:hypothetical protein
MSTDEIVVIVLAVVLFVLILVAIGLFVFFRFGHLWTRIEYVKLQDD